MTKYFATKRGQVIRFIQRFEDEICTLLPDTVQLGG